jgi:hypothetical protein
MEIPKPLKPIRQSLQLEANQMLSLVCPLMKRSLLAQLELYLCLKSQNK